MNFSMNIGGGGASLSIGNTVSSMVTSVMGGGATSGGATVVLDCENLTIEPGQEVKGMIHIRVHNPNGVDVKNLKLKLTGTEKTHFMTQEQKRVEFYNRTTNQNDVKFETIHVPRSGAKEFLSTTIEVANLSSPDSRFTFGGDTVNNLPQGDFSIPFSFQMPRNLPASSNFDGKRVHGPHINKHQDFGAEVTYRVRAFIERPGMRDISDLADVQELCVLEKPPYITGATAEMKNDVYAFACCFKQGECDVLMVSNKNAYCCGDQVEIGTRFTNRSPKDMKAFRARLNRKIVINDDKGHSTSSFDMISEARMPGCLAGEEKEVMFKMLLDKAKMARHGREIPTCLGNLVEVTYYLEVAAEVGTCIRSCKVDIPVVVYSSKDTNQIQKARVPSDWNPVTFEAARMAKHQMPQIAVSAAYNTFFADYRPATQAQLVAVSMPPPPTIVVQQPAAPQIVIQQPAAPQVVVQQPAPAVVVQQPAPSVVVQQPAPAPVVMQQPTASVVVEQPPMQMHAQANFGMSGRNTVSHGSVQGHEMHVQQSQALPGGGMMTSTQTSARHTSSNHATSTSGGFSFGFGGA